MSFAIAYGFLAGFIAGVLAVFIWALSSFNK